MTSAYTRPELMVAAAAREIRDGEVVFVGMRLPLLAYCLARSTHAPTAVGVFENGVVRDSPALAFLVTMSDGPNVTGAVWLDRMLFTATQYPTDYGFVPQTLAEDGDPLDVLVLLDEATFPGCHILARPVGDGVEVFTSSQAPHKVREVISEILGVDPGLVRVATPDIGGGFGVKAHAYPEEVALAAVALRTGRPVKWVEDRAENLAASTQARAQELRVRAGMTEDGDILRYFPLSTGVPIPPAGKCEPDETGCGTMWARPVVGPYNRLYLSQAASPGNGGSLIGVDASSGTRRPWHVGLHRVGSEFWRTIVSQHGMIFALAVEPEASGGSSATVLAIDPGTEVHYAVTLVEP